MNGEARGSPSRCGSDTAKFPRRPAPGRAAVELDSPPRARERDRAEIVRRRPWVWRRDVVSAPRPLASAPRRRVAALLGNRTGVLREAVSAMVMSGCALTPLLLPLRVTARRNRSAWMQYCSLCLADDASPYFRRQRRLASRISCFVHGRGCVIVVPPAAVRSPPLIRTNLSLSISAPNAGSTCAWRRKLSSSLSAAARKMHRRYLQVGADHRFEDGRRFGFTPVARTGPGRQHFGEKPHKPRRRASAALSS